MKNTIFESVCVTVQKGMWQLLANYPWILWGCIILMNALPIACLRTRWYGTKRAKNNMLIIMAVAFWVSMLTIMGCFYSSRELSTSTATPTQTPTTTPTPTPSMSKLDKFSNMESYSREYNIFSSYENTVPSVWGLKYGTMSLAEKTLMEVDFHPNKMNFLPSGDGKNLEIDTLKSDYNVFSVSMPMGESLYTYGAFEVPKKELSWKSFEKRLDEGVSKAIWANRMELATSRAYQLSILEGQRRVKKRFLQEMLEEDAFKEIENISIDGVQFKKSGKMLEVKQSDIESMFDFGKAPDIDEPSEEESINLYFEGESKYEEMSSIFDGIRKYREDKGLSPVTGFSS